MLEVPTERTLRERVARQPAGFVSLAVGLLAVIVACAVQLGEDPFFSAHPDPRITLPFFAIAAGSTVVSLVGGKPVLLRPGVLHIEGLEAAAETEGAHPSPGMHAKHYSPRTKIILGPPPKSGNGCVLELPPDPRDAASRLYATLHELDEMNYDWIAVELPADTPEWAGVRDRLTRAAHR